MFGGKFKTWWRGIFRPEKITAGQYKFTMIRKMKPFIVLFLLWILHQKYPLEWLVSFNLCISCTQICCKSMVHTYKLLTYPVVLQHVACILWLKLLCDTVCMLHLLSIGSLRVTIRRDAGIPTAGQSYSLTCIVILSIAGSPTIRWLGPNNKPLAISTSVTVENKVMVNDSVYERTLVFSSLHTSHGGQYTCQTTLGQASAVTSAEFLVKSA